MNDYSDAISPIAEILQDAAAGKMFILVDHEDRENEGDLVIPAQMATPEVINFMATHGRGLICLTLTGERVDELGLVQMAPGNSSRYETPFTVSIEAREGVTTGISAPDRARTVAVAIDPAMTAADIAIPGHIFPLRAHAGGVLVRAGHTEAAVDVSRLAGLNPSGVICEIMNEDGSMARLPELVEFAQKHQMKIGTIADLIAYRRRHDNLVTETTSKTVQSKYGGEWKMQVFTDEIKGAEHIALSKGDIGGDDPVLVRVHMLDPLSDALGLGSVATTSLPATMGLIAKEGRGVVLLLRDDESKLLCNDSRKSSSLRQYGLGAQILSCLGLSRMIIVSNSPLPKMVGLDAYGLSIEGGRQIPAQTKNAEQS